MTDDLIQPGGIAFRLDLTAAQLKIVHTALKSLFDDLLEEGELDEKNDSSVRNAAELFLSREYGLPYYFGPECVARLASLNIKQFLGIDG